MTEQQTEQVQELYRLIGELVVAFEHTIDAAKMKYCSLCGLTPESMILLEPLNARYTAKVLKDLIELRLANNPSLEVDRPTYDAVVRDLYKLNDDRNAIIHHTWFIGWKSSDADDLSRAHGIKFRRSPGFKSNEISTERVRELIVHCRVLYRVLYTGWSIDRIPGVPLLSSIWQSVGSGNWVDLRP